jgi:hypothetical protein
MKGKSKNLLQRKDSLVSPNGFFGFVVSRKQTPVLHLSLDNNNNNSNNINNNNVYAKFSLAKKN